MQWEVIGADRDTGAERSIIVEADDEGSASRRGNRRGLMVSAVRPLDPMDSVAGTPVVIDRRPVVAQVVPDSVGFAYAPPPVAYGGYPSFPGRPPKGTSGLGVAALVLGILAAIICWVPFLGLLAIPLGAIGLLLALIGVVISAASRRSSMGMPMAGGVVCLLPIVVSIGVTGVMAGAVGKVAQQAQAANARQLQTRRTNTSLPATAPAPTLASQAATPAADVPHEDPAPVAAPALPQPIASVTADAILASYTSNEVAADGAYKGNVIAVTGVVEKVGKDVLGSIYVVFKPSDAMSFRRAQCFFSDDSASAVAKVEAGATYKIVGRCDGMMGNVMLKDCYFSQ